MELVIASKDLRNTAAGIAKDDEVFHEIEEAALIEDALENRFQFRRALGRQVVAGNGPPWHETLTLGSERTDARGKAIRNDQHRVRAEQRADLRLVGLQLIEGAVERGVLVAWVLEFDHTQGQAV